MDQRPVKCKIIKFLEYNIEENLDDHGFWDNCLDTTPQAWPLKEIIDELHFIKIKTSALLKTLSRE